MCMVDHELVIGISKHMYEIITANYATLFRESSPLNIDWRVEANFDLIRRSDVLREAFNRLRTEFYQFCKLTRLIQLYLYWVFNRYIKRGVRPRGRATQTIGYRSRTESYSWLTFETVISHLFPHCLRGRDSSRSINDRPAEPDSTCFAFYLPSPILSTNLFGTLVPFWLRVL